MLNLTFNKYCCCFAVMQTQDNEAVSGAANAERAVERPANGWG